MLKEKKEDNWLKENRDLHGLSQAHIALYLGVTPRQVINYEKGDAELKGGNKIALQLLFSLPGMMDTLKNRLIEIKKGQKDNADFPLSDNFIGDLFRLKFEAAESKHDALQEFVLRHLSELEGVSYEDLVLALGKNEARLLSERFQKQDTHSGEYN